jgi:VCBS repeat-containing protein
LVQGLNVGGTLSDTFTVTSVDGTARVVTVTINGTNDAAVIAGTSTGAVTEASGVANAIAGTPTATGTLTSTDVDNAANTFTPVAAGAASANGYGTYAMTAGGVWTYTLNNSHASVQALNVGNTLSDTFTVTSVDGTSRVVTVTINGANDAAVISGTSTGAVTEASGVANAIVGTPTASGTLTSTDADNPANTFTAVAAGTASTNGYGTYAMTAGGVWTYTLNNSHASVQALNVGNTLSDTFTVTSADGTSRVVTVTINGANDTPIGVADTRTLLEDAGPTTGNVLSNDSDIEGSALSVTQFVFDGNTYAAGTTANVAGLGSLVINTNGSYTFTPATNYAGSVPVTYTVSDGSATASSTLAITVTPVADAPTLTINGATAPPGGSITLPATIPAGTGLTQAYFAPGANGITTVNASNLGAFETAIEGMTPTSTSTSTNVTVAEAGNAADSAYRITGFVYLEAGKSYTLSGYRDDTLLIKIGGTQVYGSAHDTFGNYTATAYTPTVSGFYSVEVNYYNGSGVGSLDINVSVDGAAAVDLSTANFPIYPDAAALASLGVPFNANGDGGHYPLVITGNEDSGIALGNISAGLTDTDGSETLALVISGIPVGAMLTDGTNTFTATGGSTSADVSGWNLAGISITPPLNYNGTINLTVTATATDPGGSPATASTTATVSITVNPVNDAPVAAADNIYINSTGTVTIQNAWLLANDSDVENDPLTVATSTAGTVTATTTTVTSNVGANASGTFSYTASDGSAGSNSATVTITRGGATNTITGGGGNDILINTANAAATLTGGAGNDFITGGTAADIIVGEQNDYLLDGGGGTDTLNVGANFTSTSDAQIIRVENVTLTAAATLDLSNQTEGFTITGSSGADSITGGGGNDTIVGAQNDTLLSGGLGTDTLNVGANFTSTSDAQIVGIENVTLTAAATLNLSNQTEGFTIAGSTGNDTITGGSGDDAITGGTGADRLTGGGGADTFSVAAGDTAVTIGGTGNAGTITGYDVITDFDVAADKLILPGTVVAVGNTTSTNGTNSTLTIGGNQVSSHRIANGIITFDDAGTYTTPLVIDSTADVAAAVQYLRANDIGSLGSTVAFTATIGGVAHTYVYTQTANGAGNYTLVDLEGVTLTNLTSLITSTAIDPLILDLGTAGLDFTPVGNGVQFDLNADGVVDQVAWTTGEDGILAFDVDGSGTIDSGSELFTPWFAGGLYSSGIAALASLDSNFDGVINADDTHFYDLKVWRDINVDGISDDGELSSLIDQGIASISLHVTPSGGAIDGQTVLSEGIFTNIDGSSGSFVEVAFDAVLGSNNTETGENPDNNTLMGSAGADIFAWGLADHGAHGTPAVDTIINFDMNTPANGGDVLDLRDLLIGENAGAGPDNLANYLHFEKSGADTVVHISSTGDFGADDHAVGSPSGVVTGAEDQKIILSGVDMIGAYTTDQQVIQDLLTRGKLNTD